MSNEEQRTTNNEHTRSDDDVLVRCEHVSKKFCKSLKRSLWYGVQDIAAEMNPFSARMAAVDSTLVDGALVGEHGTQTHEHTNTPTHNSSPTDAELRRDEFWAVKDVSFELRRGECLGLIGHNGAGKSTLLKILNGIIKPDRGRVEMRGRVGALIELGAGFNPVLTGRENIYNKGAIHGFTRQKMKEKFDAIVDFAEIGDFLEMPVQNYSSGMKVRLGFAVSAMMEPDVLIIDEVLAVGDLGFIIKCLNRMAEIIPNSAVIFVSHSMPMVNRICTRAMLMDRGAEEYYGDDIAHAIEQYIHKFSEAGTANQGNGDIEVGRIGLRESEDQPYVYDGTYIQQNGKPLQVEIEYKILNHDIKEFRASLIMLDQQLREILSCRPETTDMTFRVPERATSVTVEASLPVIYPNTGRHTLTVLASDPVLKKMYCRTTNAASFMARAPSMGWAAMIMQCPWQLKVK